jgi:DNA-binding transcriptional LysR family regulator
VLTDRSAITAGRDYGVLSGRTWRLADLAAKQAMLLAGLGWGNMPVHLVRDDIARGGLKVIQPVEFDARTAQLVMGSAYLSERQLGPAGRWMVEHLSSLESGKLHP